MGTTSKFIEHSVGLGRHASESRSLALVSIFDLFSFLSVARHHFLFVVALAEEPIVVINFCLLFKVTLSWYDIGILEIQLFGAIAPEHSEGWKHFQSVSAHAWVEEVVVEAIVHEDVRVIEGAVNPVACNEVL